MKPSVRPRINANKRRYDSFLFAFISVHSRLMFLLPILSSCGYHVAGKADLVPKTIHTIAIPAFANITIRYKLTDQLPQAISREFIARTRYQDRQRSESGGRGIAWHRRQLRALTPFIFDQPTGRASGLQVNVTHASHAS